MQHYKNNENICKKSSHNYNLRKRKKKCEIKYNENKKPKIIISSQLENDLYNILTKKLSTSEININSKEINDIIQKFVEKEPSVDNLVKCDIPFQKKLELLETFYYNVIKYDPHKISIRNTLYYNMKSDDDIFSTKEKQLIKQMDKDTKIEKHIIIKILEATIPYDRKVIIYKKYMDVIGLNSSSENRCKTIEWVNRALSLPYKKKALFFNKKIKNIGKNIQHVKKILDNELYGQNNAKEKILEIVSAILSGSKYTDIIGFIGPPGTGKTKFAQILGKVLGLPFHQISLGGVDDASILRGHSLTYLNSMPGNIANGLIKMKYINGIFFLDEIDKMGNDKEKNPSGSLLHILDPQQNYNFNDHYFQGINIDLSNILFVVSLNCTKNLEPNLKNRLNLIRFKKYSINDKVKIAQKYFIPQEIKKLHINSKDIILSNDIIKYIVQNGIDEPGVRNLKMNIRQIISRINILNILKKSKVKMNISYNIKQFKIPFKVEKKHINKLIINKHNDNQEKLIL